VTTRNRKPRSRSSSRTSVSSKARSVSAGGDKNRAFETLLRSDPELLRSLVDQAADAVCLHEIGGRILDVNKRMCTTLGYSRDELLALSVLDVDVTATREETADAAARLVPGKPQLARRVLRRKDGSTFPIELSLSLVESGGRQFLLGIARDITHHERARLAQEETQRMLEQRVRERTQHLEVANRRLEDEMQARELLLRELDHRVKNALATVQGVAELTVRTTQSLATFRDTFRDRVSALARMHAVIWRNKATPVALRELVDTALTVLGSESDRCSVEGEEVTVAFPSAGAIGLVLHELATNAIKHGAFSTPAGRVGVRWCVERDQLDLEWCESGGPPVAKPKHTGFGSLLIEQAVPYELGGTATLEFEPGGVRCKITVPLAPVR